MDRQPDPAIAEIVPYDAMRRAIEAASEIDIVKHIRDQARASEIAAQGQKPRNPNPRPRIRLRAERKAGQILKSVIRPRGRQSPRAPAPPPTLKQRGISKRHSAHWQKLAALPDQQFEAWLLSQRDPKSPGARYTARWRERKRRDIHCLTLEIRPADIDALVRRHMLDRDARSDPRAVKKALYWFFSDFLGGPDAPPKRSSFWAT
jgi:hypothetical protein